MGQYHPSAVPSMRKYASHSAGEGYKRSTFALYEIFPSDIASNALALHCRKSSHCNFWIRLHKVRTRAERPCQSQLFLFDLPGYNNSVKELYDRGLCSGHYK